MCAFFHFPYVIVSSFHPLWLEKLLGLVLTFKFVTTRFVTQELLFVHLAENSTPRLSFLIQVKIFPVLVMTDDFQLKPGYFGFCAMRLWILFKSIAVAGVLFLLLFLFLFLSCFVLDAAQAGKRNTDSLLPGMVRSPCSPLAHAHAWRERFLVTAGGGGCSGLLVGLPVMS